MSNASEQLLDEIRNCDQEFMDAYNAGDANAVAQLYDDKCSLMPANMEPIHSKKEIEEFFQNAMANGMKTVTLNTDEVQGTDEWAFERGNYVFNEGQNSSAKGIFVVVWHKVSGHWKIYVDCFHPSA